MSKDLTQEQIEAFREFVLRLAGGNKLLVQDYEYSQFCDELERVSQMAIKGLDQKADLKSEQERVKELEALLESTLPFIEDAKDARHPDAEDLFSEIEKALKGQEETR